LLVRNNGCCQHIIALLQGEIGEPSKEQITGVLGIASLLVAKLINGNPLSSCTPVEIETGGVKVIKVETISSKLGIAIDLGKVKRQRGP
jgi:hypothetical protein